VLLTTVLDAEPDARYSHPGPSLAPLLAALAVGVTFIGGIFTPWAFVVGPVLLFPALLLWLWTQDKQQGPPTYAEEPA
jgi:cytochrome c oxidase subunit I+III